MWNGLALAEQPCAIYSLLHFSVQSLPVHERGKAADTMAMEAYRRVQDPVYGCAGVIVRLQEEIRAAQSELARTQAQIAAQPAAPTTHHQLMNAQALAPPQQQAGDAPMMVQQEPFQGLAALYLDDVRAGNDLFDDDTST
jgi:hypothetical protein